MSVLLTRAGLFSVATVAVRPCARPDVVAFLLNVAMRPGQNFANASIALSYGQRLCDKVSQGPNHAQFTDDAEADFTNRNENQASYLISQAVSELWPRVGPGVAKLRSAHHQLSGHRRLTERKTDMNHRSLTVCALLTMGAGAVLGAPATHADNKRLNDGVVANVFTVQHQAGCTNDVKINPQLQLAAQRHTLDVLNNRNIDGDIGSDGSTPQDRADAAGFHRKVAETVAINPAVAISGVELMNQWYYNAADFAIMSNCANSQIGVWSENSPDRTVVVAVYGESERQARTAQQEPQTGPPPVVAPQENVPIDPSPDYDATDEIEFGVNWLPWILRGVYPPPGMPPA